MVGILVKSTLQAAAHSLQPARPLRPETYIQASAAGEGGGGDSGAGWSWEE